MACLFIPSVIFWGSGILKDSVTLGALCWMTFFLFQITIFKQNQLISLVFLLFFGWIIFSIKIYILLCFLVSTISYLYLQNLSRIKNSIVKIILAPLFLVIFVGAGYLILNKVTEGNSRYTIDRIAETAKITAYDIRYGWGARQGDNSGYTLGELDGSFGSFISLAPKGIIVTLFRPWPWEVKNPLMLLAAIESLFFLCATIYCIYTIRFSYILKSSSLPLVLFCLSFSLLFAFAIGVSTYNFGTLMRYKIPIMPFYSSLLILILDLRQNS
ncbi:hypothetical protein [Reichenbachiella faecimaris]|uniref:hypothetical protein n=1 Tax=Reichenbachiella faecimaris TaxID=692418 RepID=UPI00111C37BE|nr:hypothetical protein [Reichenbachiella faecimaris]